MHHNTAILKHFVAVILQQISKGESQWWIKSININIVMICFTCDLWEPELCLYKFRPAEPWLKQARHGVIIGSGRVRYIKIYFASMKCVRSIFSTNSGSLLFYTILWLAIPLIKDILDSPTQYLANATFGTSEVFQMEEKMILKKYWFAV